MTDDLLSRASLTVMNSKPKLTINVSTAREHWLEGMLRHEIGKSSSSLLLLSYHTKNMTGYLKVTVKTAFTFALNNSSLLNLVEVKATDTQILVYPSLFREIILIKPVLS